MAEGDGRITLDEWTKRDLSMLSTLIAWIQEDQIKPYSFNNPRRRRFLASVRWKAADAMQGILSTCKGLSDNARNVIEAHFVRFKIPIPPAPIKPVTQGPWEVDDGQSKPLKPPIRYTMDEDD